MSLIRKSNQKTFDDIYSTYDDFSTDLSGSYSIFKPSDMDDDHLKKTYYLLVARYGDTPIVSYWDEARWKLKLFQVIDEYGPEWQTKRELQKDIRARTLDDFKSGGKAVYNTALNPNTAPSTDTLDELEYINSQNVTKRTVSDYDAIVRKLALLEDGLDDDYLGHFSKLFSKFTQRDRPLYVYANEEEG